MKMWEIHGTLNGERVRVTIWARTYGRAMVEAMYEYPDLLPERAFRIH